MKPKFNRERILRTEGDVVNSPVQANKKQKFIVPKSNSFVFTPKFTQSCHQKNTSKESITISLNKMSQEKLLDLLCLSTQELKQKFLKPQSKHEKIKIINNNHLPKDFFSMQTQIKY